MILHIFPREKFTVPFINFVNKNFDKQEHLFFLDGFTEGYKGNDLEYEYNVKDIKREKIIFLKAVYSAEKIILHSLFISNKLLLYLLLNIKLSKKCSWVIWGGDLYSYRIQSTLKSKILELIKTILVKRFQYIITLSKNDYKLAKKWYGVKGEYKQGIYINPISFDYLKNIKLNNTKDRDTVNIQIGNSADPSNLHFEAIDILEKFKEEDIKIYAPLSYGNSEYAIKVKEYGESIFKDKFIAMINFLDKEKYGKFLSKIDIAVFNNNRQQALGNIRALAYLGSKIYIRNDTTMWNDFISDGYKINEMNDLKNENFEEFIQKNNNTIDLNSNLAEDTFNQNRIAKKWEDIFNS